MTPDAAYSGTPLPRKLGIKPGDEVAVLGGPASVADRLSGLPGVGPPRRNLSGSDPLDEIVFFVIWRAARVPTDMTEDGGRDGALPTGRVDNKLCAIDEVWSGLRLVIRRELRPPTAGRAGASAGT